MNHCTKAGLDLNAKAELWVVLLQPKIVSVHVVAFPTPLASPYHPFRATEKKQASEDDLHSCGWHLWFANLNTRMQGKNSIHLFECEYNLFISCHDFETLNTKWLQIWGTSTKPFMGTDSEFVQILTENVGHIRLSIPCDMVTPLWHVKHQSFLTNVWGKKNNLHSFHDSKIIYSWRNDNKNGVCMGAVLMVE